MACFLAQALASAALLSADLSDEDERVSVQLRVSGPAGGCFADASTDGSLRGYTDRKVLERPHGHKVADLSAALGSRGLLTVIHSDRHRVIASGQVAATPPDLRTALARYYNSSLRRPAAVELLTRTGGQGIARAAALLAVKMPGGNSDTFVGVLERFQDRTALKALAEGCPHEGYGNLFALDDLRAILQRNLRFSCSCSRGKFLTSLAGLPENERRALLNSRQPQTVTCNLCGKNYSLPFTDLRDAIACTHKT